MADEWELTVEKLLRAMDHALFSGGSALDIALKLAREKGGDPKLLVVHPLGAEKLGGAALVKAWAASNEIDCRLSEWVPEGQMYFVTPPDLSWSDPASAIYFDPWRRF